MEFKTPGGKTIVLYNEGYSIRVKFREGGELPVELTGKWTDERFAVASVLKYIDVMGQLQEEKDKKPKIKLNKDDYKRD